jgi:hypothetical protein
VQHCLVGSEMCIRDSPRGKLGIQNSKLKIQNGILLFAF